MNRSPSSSTRFSVFHENRINIQISSLNFLVDRLGLLEAEMKYGWRLHLEKDLICSKLGTDAAALTKMSRIPPLLPQLILISFLIAGLLHPCHGDFGTASKYGPPYVPTACYGSDTSVFPSNNLFASAGDSIWDNDAACGRQYMVRCLSAAVPGICLNASIEIQILDYAGDGVSDTMVLSETAFATIADPNAESMNIEFQQL